MSEFINTIDLLGDDAVTDSIINRSITEFNDNKLLNVGVYAFSYCKALTTVNVPLARSLGQYAFYYCDALTTVNAPSATTLGYGAFHDCKALTTVNFPLAKTTEFRTFYNCVALKVLNLPSLTKVGSSAIGACNVLETVDTASLTKIDDGGFASCYSLKAVILRNQTMATLEGTGAFNKCYHILGTRHATYNLNADKDGYIYVPAALVDSYKTATNWSTYASQIRALEDYTVDGTTTGELDPNKI